MEAQSSDHSGSKIIGVKEGEHQTGQQSQVSHLPRRAAHKAAAEPLLRNPFSPHCTWKSTAQEFHQNSPGGAQSLPSAHLSLCMSPLTA